MNIQNRHLRPLSLIGLFRETLNIYMSNFALIAGISAITCILFWALAAFLTFVLMPAFDPTESPGYWLSLLIFMTVTGPVVTGAIAPAVLGHYLGRRMSVLQCYRRAWNVKRLFVLVGTMFAAFVPIGMVLCVPLWMLGVAGFIIVDGGPWPILVSILVFVPGTIVLALVLRIVLRYALVVPVFPVESAGAIGALRRSWHLMKGHTGRAFLLVSVVGLVFLLADVAVTFQLIPTTGLDPSLQTKLLFDVLTAAVFTLMLPIAPMSIVLLYYDIRVRKEGFDLEYPDSI